MRPKCILVYDGELGLAQSIQKIIPKAFALKLLSVQQAFAVNAFPLRTVVVFCCFERITTENLDLIIKMSSDATKYKFFYVGEEPGSRDIVSLFRAGVSDVIFTPLASYQIKQIQQKILDSTRFHVSERIRAILRHLKIIISVINCLIAKMASVITFRISRKRCFAKVRSVRVATRIGASKIDHSLDLKCFGNLLIALNGEFIDHWPNRKGRGIFTYLAISQQKIFRDILMDKFWPKSSADSAKNSLHVTLHTIRKLLQAYDSQYEFILFDQECYYLNPELQFASDVNDFRKAWREGSAFEGKQNYQLALKKYQFAAEKYCGDFLEDELYEEWPTLERENLRETYLHLLDRMSNLLVKQNQIEKAIEICEKLLQKDMCREDIHRRLMQCFYMTGRRDRAIIQFQKCEQLMLAELGVPPSRATRELQRRICSETTLLD